MFDFLSESFESQFGMPPTHLARAPGRVNLIGEHTDYNRGLVLPMAINRWVNICFRPRVDDQVTIHSINFNQTAKFSLGDPLQNEDDQSWSNYVKAVASVLLKSSYDLNGFDAVMYGNIPLASGLSSSAAVEIASLLTFAASSGLNIEDPLEIALLAQQAENEFIGVQCGLMDQLISAAGQKGKCLRIDFNTLKVEAFEIPAEIGIVVGDTKLSRQLAGSTYNQRRLECERAIELINNHQPDRTISSISDLAGSQLNDLASILPDVLYRRVRHVVTENARVQQSVEAMEVKDFHELGKMFNSSHRSLRDDYEVSSEGLDLLAENMRSHESCFGARLTGAGFGGCAIAIVSKPKLADFIDDINALNSPIQPQPELFSVQASLGGQVVKTE